METKQLKNGSVEVTSLITVTLMSLNSLIKQDPISFYELVTKCRNREHTIFGNCGDILRDLQLIQSDNSVHDSIKNIVLSAVSGEGFEMILGNPIATEMINSDLK